MKQFFQETTACINSTFRQCNKTINIIGTTILYKKANIIYTLVFYKDKYWVHCSKSQKRFYDDGIKNIVYHYLCPTLTLKFSFHNYRCYKNFLLLKKYIFLKSLLRLINIIQFNVRKFIPAVSNINQKQI